MYWADCRSTRAGEKRAPDCTVRSMMWPARTSRSFMRTCAEPRPILMCWTSSTWYSVPSISRVTPLRRSPVSIIASPLLHQLGRVAHHPRLPVLEHYHVFDAHAAPAADVDPRLDRGDHPLLQLILRQPGQPRRFVDQQPDAVAEAVAEVLAVARLGDDVVRQHVSLLAAHAGADKLLRRELRRQDDVVYLAEAGVLAAHSDRAGEVGAVAVHPYPHIDDDWLAGLYRAVAGLGVGHRPPGAGGGDRLEGEAVGAVLAGVAFDLPGDLELRPAGLDPPGHVLERLVAQVDGALKGGHLRRLLDRPQLLNQRRRRQ